MTAPIIYEYVAVACYLSGMFVGIKFMQNTQNLFLRSSGGFLLIPIGAVLDFPPLYFLGAHISCWFVGVFMLDFCLGIKDDVFKIANYSVALTFGLTTILIEEYVHAAQKLPLIRKAKEKIYREHLHSKSAAVTTRTPDPPRSS